MFAIALRTMTPGDAILVLATVLVCIALAVAKDGNRPRNP